MAGLEITTENYNDKEVRVIKLNGQKVSRNMIPNVFPTESHYKKLKLTRVGCSLIDVVAWPYVLDMSVSDICRLAGVHRTDYYRMMKDPLFRKALEHAKARTPFNFLPQVVDRQLVKAINEGDTQAAKFIGNDVTGKLIPASQRTEKIDINIEAKAQIEGTNSTALEQLTGLLQSLKGIPGTSQGIKPLITDNDNDERKLIECDYSVDPETKENES